MLLRGNYAGRGRRRATEGSLWTFILLRIAAGPAIVRD
jgi:hypothetical protein